MKGYVSADGTVRLNGNSRLKTSDITLIAFAAGLMAVCSWISIPFAVPFTMQTFAVFSSVGILGGKRGSIAVAVYILLGAIGLPVFSGFTGGVGVLFGITGGYIAGFLFSALFMWLCEVLFGRGKKVLFLSMLGGLLICYAIGTVYFRYIYTRNTGDIGILAVLSSCVFPFVLPDIIKILLSMSLTGTIRKYLNNN
ncbi:MAG: biotin transporter BioY [Eubacteriales bacterium]|nr:biotin transporter BioY [Eubacteriales bacterium]